MFELRGDEWVQLKIIFMEKKLKCPECGKKNIKVGGSKISATQDYERGKKALEPTENVYYCEDCKKEPIFR